MSKGKPPPATVSLTINGQAVDTEAGTLLVEAAAAAGIEIPIFCYEPRLGAPIGACRMCLVEIEGMRGLQTACSTVVAPDMVVHTNNEAAATAQDGVLELLLANHPLDCPVCDKGGECPLQDRTFRFGPGETRFVEPKRHFPKPLDLSSRVAIDRERCIACYRCIRFSQDVAEDGQLGFQERGAGTEVATFSGDPYEGRFTGNIIDLCPVGALTSIPYRFVSRPWDVQNTPSVCGLCPVGCNTELTMREGETKRVTGRPDPNMVVEEGWICDKGRWGYPAAWSSDRLTSPLVRDHTGRLVEASLEEAVDAAALLIARAQSSHLLIGSDRTVEEGFVARELASALPQGSASRCGFPDVEHLNELRSIERAELGDLDGADVVVVVGGDIANRHPIIELRLRKVARNRGRLIVTGHHPQPFDDVAESVIRTRPGAIADACRTIRAHLGEATSPVIVWDERDVADDPQAAAALATMCRESGARQVECAADVNGAGLRALGLAVEQTPPSSSVLLTVCADPLEAPGSAAWDGRIGSQTVVAIATHRSSIVDTADVVLPTLMHHEIDGVLVAGSGRAQRLRPGARGPEEAATAWELLVALSYRVGIEPLPYRTPAAIFSAAASSAGAFAGLDYDALGLSGAQTAPVTDVRGLARDGEASGAGLAAAVTTEIFGDTVSWQSDALEEVRTTARVIVSPRRAEMASCSEGATVLVRSPHGECEMPLSIDPNTDDDCVRIVLGPTSSGSYRLLDVTQAPIRVEIETAG